MNNAKLINAFNELLKEVNATYEPLYKDKINAKTELIESALNSGLITIIDAIVMLGDAIKQM